MPRRLAVVAGSGALAPEVVEAAINAGDTVRVLALGAVQMPDPIDVVRMSVADPATVIAAIREFGATHLVLAGAVNLSEDIRRGISGALGSSPGGTGDMALSSSAGQLQALTGAALVGVHQLVPGIVARAGLLAGPALDGDAARTARMAFHAAREIGRLDLGQAAVAAGTRLVAAEDVTGTDALIERVGRYRADGLFGGAGTAIVLAKASKPQQPHTIDLPAIGPDTMRRAHEAGISAIVVEAGRTLLIRREQALALATERGLSVVGLEVDG